MPLDKSQLNAREKLRSLSENQVRGSTKRFGNRPSSSFYDADQNWSPPNGRAEPGSGISPVRKLYEISAILRVYRSPSSPPRRRFSHAVRIYLSIHRSRCATPPACVIQRELLNFFIHEKLPPEASALGWKKICARRGESQVRSMIQRPLRQNCENSNRGILSKIYTTPYRETSCRLPPEITEIPDVSFSTKGSSEFN